MFVGTLLIEDKAKVERYLSRHREVGIPAETFEPRVGRYDRALGARQTERGASTPILACFLDSIPLPGSFSEKYLVSAFSPTIIWYRHSVFS